ncbi:Kae1-associated serine/threonine protein kinase [Candidatus Pacearchaeota archaeon]|nr:Kae1-associated serine/threonine protein kinase [Candidatus Pacearchaeota archaeon]
MKTIAQGAEAIIFKEGNKVTKDRIKKSYRIPEIDNKIRTRRTKSETKLLIKASQIINCPKPIIETQAHQIKMPFIDGKKLSEHLDKFPLTKQKQICKQIGESIAKLHDNNIIHGDLTTSNMIYVPTKSSLFKKGGDENLSIKTKTPSTKKSFPLNKSQAKKSGKADFEAINPRDNGERIFFIDFGLGFISQRYEDKAVDLHLLKQALEAKHFKHWEVLFKVIIKRYKNSKDADKILKQLEKVEKRGRYKK